MTGETKLKLFESNEPSASQNDSLFERARNTAGCRHLPVKKVKVHRKLSPIIYNATFYKTVAYVLMKVY